MLLMQSWLRKALPSVLVKICQGMEAATLLAKTLLLSLDAER